jgi:hypothetical protein
VVAAVLLGLGIAIVYSTLLAAIGDVAQPSRRARNRLRCVGRFAVGVLQAEAQRLLAWSG